MSFKGISFSMRVQASFPSKLLVAVLLLSACFTSDLLGAEAKRTRRKTREERADEKPSGAFEIDCRLEEDLGRLLAMGNKLLAGGKKGFQLARQCFHRAASVHRDSVDARLGLAAVEGPLGNPEGAARLYDKVLELSGGKNVKALLGKGMHLLRKGGFAEAEELLSAAVALEPKSVPAQYNLALAYTYQHKYVEAAERYRETAKLSPDNADVHQNLGGVLFGLGELEEAIKHLSIATDKSPTVGNLKNLGSAQAKHGKFKDAAATFDKVLSMDPTERSSVSRRTYCSQQICSWAHWERDMRMSTQLTQEQLRRGDLPSTSPFDALSMPMNATVLYGVAAANAQSIAAEEGNPEPLARPNSRTPGCQLSVPKTKAKKKGGSGPGGCRLRVGYVSSDFREHPVGYQMFQILQQHSQAVEVFVYAINPDNGSEFRERIKGVSEHFVDINPMSPAEAAARIAADKIDVLVNLNGYTLTARNGIFAHRPAPLQVLFLGYYATMGASYIDYVVTDRVASPSELAGHFSESLLQMPHSLMAADHAFTHPRDIAGAKLHPLTAGGANSSEHATRPVEPRSSGETAEIRGRFGLPAEGFVFCSFNTMYKMDPGTFGAWAAILHRVPRSVLWVQKSPAEGATNLKAEMAAGGIDPARLVLVPWLDDHEHLRVKSVCQLFLDTPNYNAHVTATDALWTGIPVLTMPGEKMASRIAASLVTTLGLSDSYLIPHSLREYEDNAVAIATEQGRWEKLHAQLVAALSTTPLFNFMEYMREWERALQVMWELHASGLRHHIHLTPTSPGTPADPSREAGEKTEL